MCLAIAEARKCKLEGKPGENPYVGAVVVKDGKLIARGHRSEQEPGEHAEFTALVKKSKKGVLAGATVYVTLEPCTRRNPPKVACVERLIERKVSRVVIGMLDPNQRITGKGIRRLRESNITVDLFPPDLMAEIEELNRDFIRSQEKKGVTGTVISGLPEIIITIDKLFFTAHKNIRFLLHALGASYKIPDSLANKLAKEIKRRERKNALRFFPIIVVDENVPIQKILTGLSNRREIYEKHGVHDFVEPKFLKAKHPFGIDVLLIDNTHALFCITTATASEQVQIGILLENHPLLISEMTDWFDKIVSKTAISFEELQKLG